MTISSYKITADLPNVGLTDIEFNFLPGKPGRRFSDDLLVLKAVPVLNVCELNFKELKELDQEHLDTDGYDFACSVAREKRGEN